MSKFIRPPFIMALAGDNQGCGHHRIRKPAEVVSRTGFAACRLSMDFLDDRSLSALHPDAIVFQQRLNYAQEIRRHRQFCPDAFFIYEIDDALSAVPEASWHRPYVLPDIDERTKEAISLCDAVTTTTVDLQNHLASFCAPGTDIRLAPNMLGRDDIEIAIQIRKQAVSALPPPTKKIRIGWGGGMGHTGDLALLNDVFIAFKDDVEWVFLGMVPDLPANVSRLFAGAVTSDRYLSTLAALNVDLIVAPLEDQLFNRCKSNLRIIESGACSYPVIASPVAPYLTNSPPIEYANSSEEWITKIQKFIDLPQEERAKKGAALNAWVRASYILDDHAEARLLSWLPKNTRIFRPRLNRVGAGIATSIAELPSDNDFIYLRKLSSFHNISDIKRACTETESDIVYIRPGAAVTDETIHALRNSTADVVAPFSNDGGPWGFPTTNSFTPLDPDTASEIQKICAQSEPRVIEVAAVSGPIVLLRRKVLSAIGCPDFDNLSPEVAILEWSIIARNRGHSVGLATNAFAHVAAPDKARQGESELASLRIGNRWPQGKSDDAALIAFRQDLELRTHRECYKSLPPENRNDYTQWTERCDLVGPRGEEAASALYRSNKILIHANSYSEWNEKSVTPDNETYYFLYPDGTKLATGAKAMISAAIKKIQTNLSSTATTITSHTKENVSLRISNRNSISIWHCPEIISLRRLS